MLKSTVPTPVTTFVPPTSAGGLALALMRKTSLSGRLKATKLLQSRLISSTHWVPLNLTMSPTSGGLGVEPVGGGGLPPLAATTDSATVVVRLPESKMAA